MPLDDDDLKALIRRANPAFGNSPLEESRVRRAVAAAERDQAAADSARRTLSRQPRRRPRWLAAGGSIAAVAAAVGGFALVGSLTTAPIQADPPPVTGTLECPAISIDALRSNEVAVEAQVSRVDGDSVELRVIRVFKGDPGAELSVPQTGDPDNALLAGRTYLIALESGFIDECDSGEATDQLRTTYEQVYGPPRTTAP